MGFGDDLASCSPFRPHESRRIVFLPCTKLGLTAGVADAHGCSQHMVSEGGIRKLAERERARERDEEREREREREREVDRERRERETKEGAWSMHRLQTFRHAGSER